MQARPRKAKLSLVVVLVVLLAAGAACQRTPDTRPLDDAGMAYSTVTSLRERELTESEVAGLVQIKQARVSDRTCLELVRLAHSRGRKFDFGQDVARLVHAGLRETSILELVRLNQIGLWVGEIHAMRLAGLTEDLVMTLSRRRAAGQESLSSGSLARLKNAAIGDDALLEMVVRGVTDDQVETILQMRMQQRLSDAELLRRIPARP